MKIKIINHIPSLKEEREYKKNLLDTNDVLASTVFAQIIHIASTIFANRLMLGGAYNVNRDNKERILNALYDIEKVLNKYE